MKFLVDVRVSMERGNVIDQKGGPAALFAHLMERFKPEAVYGNPTRRQVLLIVDLPTEADMSELAYILTWAAGTDPIFTPLMTYTPEVSGRIFTNALKAPAIGRPWE